MAPPTYLHRLRLEGTVLAGCGALGSLGLLIALPGSRHSPLSTIIQLAIVVALLALLGPRGVRRSIAASSTLSADDVGSGEPTPLWHVVAIVVVLAVIAGEAAGWDAGLRVTLGCMLVGLFQALILGGCVTVDERATGLTYYRVKGSRILRGTRLGHVPAGPAINRAAAGRWSVR